MKYATPATSQPQHRLKQNWISKLNLNEPSDPNGPENSHCSYARPAQYEYGPIR